MRKVACFPMEVKEGELTWKASAGEKIARACAAVRVHHVQGVVSELQGLLQPVAMGLLQSAVPQTPSSRDWLVPRGINSWLSSSH